ncbi:MAG: homocysteine S-methyltransferase family protein [Lachnospiraceae bacterium]|nr:homocysteine S-methyltransferase family protein [Lachnospiraceae bacterium]
MTKAEFQKWIRNRIVYLDGATGSNLQRRGMPAGVCPEKWILENREILIGLQREYVEAGTNILYAPTFSGNRIKLREYGLSAEAERMNRELVELSKEAAGGRALIAGDLTMTGEQIAPLGRMDFEELVDIYKEQIGYLVAAGVDLLVVETMMSLQECRAALIAAKETCGLPVLVSMTFESDGRSLYGTDAVTAALTLESLGADAVGANCSTGPDQMLELIRSMVENVHIPVIAKPNAGLPTLDALGNTVYDMDAETFGCEMRGLAEVGAVMLGGCCGTTPEHIACMVRETAKMLPVSVEKKQGRFLTAERKTLRFGLNDPFLIVGERINPTGKKKLQAELREGSLELVRQFAEEQEERGAAILDINMGMSGIDEKEMMLRVLNEVTQIVQLPLAVDSSHVDVLEAALRRYPGRALINSISLESAKFEPLLEIAKKYGAMFILLPLSDEGLPKNLQEKKEIIEKIVNRALELGLKKEDIVVDGLVATVGANPLAAMETLETIRYCKERGLATICGLSNISFGLPQRSMVNTAFLTMAIQAGLTMAIANPSQELLVNSAYAADLLLNKEGADIRYIERMNALTEKAGMADVYTGIGTAGGTNGASDSGKASVSGELSPAEKVREAVLKGNRKQITERTKAAIESGMEARVLLDEYLLPAINEVGELFDKGKYFLPQLIASAETMKLSIEYLEPLLAEKTDGASMPAVVIATVEGDIHDIGKNLVALMLKNYGFQVFDLGKDVPKEKIIEEAVRHQAKLICLSALMTTTMQEMKHVIEYKKEQGVDALVMVGGAVITQDYADEIGADGYSTDAADAVRVAKRLLHLEES